MRDFKFTNYPWGVISGLLLAGASFGWRYAALAQTPYANGWDSYFYLLQLKSWIETGRMHSPEYALIYPALRVFYNLTGDYATAAKCCAAALTGWLTYIICRLECRATGWPGVATAWVVFSPHLTYFAAQYPKNLLGVGCFACCVLYCASFRTPIVLSGVDFLYKNTRRALAVAGLLVLNYVGHKLTFALSAAFMALWAFFAVEKTAWRAFFLQKKRIAWALAIGVCMAAAVWYLYRHEWERAGQFFAHAQFGPWAFMVDFDGWPPWAAESRVSGWWAAEIGAALMVWLVSFLWPSSPTQRALTGLGLLLLIPWSEWSLTSLAYRFFLMFVLLAPWCWAVQVRSQRWPERVVAGLLLMASAWSWQSYQPARHDPDYAVLDRATRRMMLHLSPDGQKSRAELIIAPNALAEYATFTTGIDAMPWLPEYFVAPDRLWRIVGNVRFEELRYFAAAEGAPDSAAVVRLSGGYCLLREDLWQAAIERAQAVQDDDFVARATTWPNPTRIRPAFLLNKK